MHRVCIGLLALACMSCQQSDPYYQQSGTAASSMFSATSMRIHPIFTQLKDWTSDGRVDGVEALVEFQDTFGDPTKASGKIIFELFEFRNGWPDPRGNRVMPPWIASLSTLSDQRLHWDRTSRAYSFLLSDPQIDPARPYVLSATFERSGGGRYFDQIVLEPHREEPASVIPSQPATTEPFRRSSQP
jgi:hypothetical protein